MPKKKPKSTQKEPIVECLNVAKIYSPREELPHSEGWRTWLRFGMAARKFTPFHALKKVSFKIFPGEAVGIIGENGSGKTTLLKLLAGITEPTEGAVKITGRVGSLLEVGAGFHPDMTGKENIYLSGAILGLTEKEVEERIGRIIEFSELKDFIDVPVKRYSSGMFVRLGFSVAIHASPDVLLLDEILAVGDEHFQRKCLSAVRRYLDDGGTILYVSHDLASLQEICPRALLLNNSRLAFDGSSVDAVSKYFYALWEKHPPRAGEHTETIYRNRFGTFDARILEVEFLDADCKPRREFHTGETLQLKIKYRVEKPVDPSTICILIRGANAYQVYGCSSVLMGVEIPTGLREHEVTLKLDELNFRAGLYDVTVILGSSHISTHKPHDWREYVYDIWYQMHTFQVWPDSADSSLKQWGFVAMDVKW